MDNNKRGRKKGQASGGSGNNNERNLLMELQRASGGGGPGPGSAAGALAELFAQQQMPPTSSSSSSNPLSLLQQQMNAIMQGQGQQQQPSPQQQQQQQSAFNNPAAAWWYLEYLSRIQQAQMIPNLESSPQPEVKKKKEKTPSIPPPPPVLPPQQNQQNNQVERPQKITEKRPSNPKRKTPDDVLNLSKMSKQKVPKLSTSPATITQPVASTSSSSALQPPQAHATPINLSTPPGKVKITSEPPQAHQNHKPVHYTHMIPKFPQIGLIGRKPEGKKKKTVASLLAQSRSPDVKEISYRPWLEDKLIIPNVSSSKKDPPDYNLPLKMGWRRETSVKNTDFKTLFEGTITYLTPQGLTCKSVNEIKKCLNQRTAELTPRHFTFNTNLLIGSFVFDYEGEKIELSESTLKEGNVLKKLKVLKEELIIKNEQLRIKQLHDEQEQVDKERKRQHNLLVKNLEILKKSKRRMKLQQERKLKKRQELEEEKEVKDDTKFEFSTDSLLKPIDKLETCLEPQAFSNLLHIYEFLNTFGETLGFDMESLPDLESLLKGFINQCENEEELQSILIHLIVCAVEDPGMSNPTKHMTSFNQTLKQADVNFGSLSEILRIYLDGISDSEPEAETYANWLQAAPFTCHNPKRKSMIVAFLCDILLQNKAVLKHLENSTELIHNCKKERVQNDVKIRKLRMVLARRAVASVCEEEEIKQEEAVEEEDDKLSVDELKAKMQMLQNTNEKLKKQMQINYKNIRTPCLGQDRYRRRFWNLPHSGGVFAEGGVSGEFEELRTLVRDKLEKNEEPSSSENIENDENVAPPEESLPNVFEVPPPVIKIFSFVKTNLCSGKRPVVAEGTEVQKGPSDEELLVKKVKKDYWNYYHVLDENALQEFKESLLENGIRERDLKSAMDNLQISKQIEKFEDTEQMESDEDIGVDPDLVYRIHLGLIETLEGLEERVAGASLQVKNWTLPLPRNLHHASLQQSEIVSIVKERVLDLEQAVERRYLKPPLGKSANELNLSNLVGEDNANAMTGEQLVNGGPCGSTSSTRGQQIQENNKLKELKEKEEKMAIANETKNSCSRFLTHWRESVRKTSSPSVLAMAIYLLDSSIAWDKSVMKACCQLCKGGDNEDKLLLCDACDRGYHTYCFKPPLEQIPDGDWFCYECINKATGNRGCIVCGKGNLQGKKLLACDKCVKAFHTDCIVPNVVKIPRGRWYCVDHQPAASGSTTPTSRKIEMLSPSKNKKIKLDRPGTPPMTPTSSDEPESQDVPLTSPPLPPPATSPKKNKKQQKEMEWCDKILDDLMGHEDAWPFLTAVNTRQFPTYKKIIKIPMDLTTIKKSLSTNMYKTRECFLADVRLIFDNCETFNEDDSPVGKAGHNLRICFESLNNFNSCESNN